MAGEIKDFPLGVSGFHFSDLYQPLRLKELHAEFWRQAGAVSPDLTQRFEAMAGQRLKKAEEAEVLIDTARHLGDFVAKLFNVTTHAARLKGATQELYPVFRLKKDFLHFKVFPRLGEAALDGNKFKDIEEQVKKIQAHEAPSSKTDPEVVFAESVLFFVDCEKKLSKGVPLDPAENNRLQNICSHLHGTALEKARESLHVFEEWCVQSFVDPERRKLNLEGWISFVRPGKIEFESLVPTESPDPQLPEKKVGPSEHLRLRSGFKLTDPRMSQKEYLREVDYCIYCHPRDKDSCSKGFAEKTGGHKKNPLGIPLAGCPLDEKISEMHVLRRSGDVIAALAMVMLDNPMCPGTGHRICNDCMKGCIFQKQDPVNIPQSETGILTDVLNLPYGFEIYSLLTRFNPLNTTRPYALPYNGINVLVVGLGPAGYTLAHYLANSGFGVVGIDGLKLEPVDSHLTGKGKAFPKPIQNYSELKRELDERILMGFGGVSEYGITVRWDKNFLAVIYLTLLRRKNMRFYGGVRFGGTLQLQDAWDLGFKHIAVATGAGRPTIIDIKNNLSRGIRKASDFLMALQLTGAFKKPSIANLQVRLPALVIGGGLTAIDTATELMAYYPIQVEKTLERFEILGRDLGEELVWAMCDPEEKEILKTFLEHGALVREERRKAEKENRKPDFISLCRQWGGVAIAYRKRMMDSPAYRLNHEEVIKALEEGIAFLENLVPVEAKRDSHGAVEAMLFKRESGEIITLPARAVMVAAGTSPNIVYEKELPGSFQLDEKKYFFQKHVTEPEEGGKWKLRSAKPGESGAFFLSHSHDGRYVTFYGDNHPDYAGNVVKAMASAKHGFPQIAKLFKTEIELADTSPADPSSFDTLLQFFDEALVPKIVKVVRLTPTIVEVIVKGRYIARKFEPGQFFRLQNYETTSHMIDGNRLTMEGIALTGAWVDKEQDLLSLIVLEMGGSSRLCSLLKPGDPVVVMGPTGAPSEIPRDETVLLVGGGLGNAVLLSIAKALRNNGSRVVYFAGYKNPGDIFKQAEIEAVTDQVIWSVDKGDPIEARRPKDRHFVGNIVQSMLAYASGKLGGPPEYPFQSVDRIIVIGSDRMMAAVTNARHGVLKPFLKEDHIAIASINSPMQCMMKEVCAQCLQKHTDPKTGRERFVFSCYNQDQFADCVDWANLNERLKMNSLAEKLTNRHLDHLLQKGKMDRV